MGKQISRRFSESGDPPIFFASFFPGRAGMPIGCAPLAHDASTRARPELNDAALSFVQNSIKISRTPKSRDFQAISGRNSASLAAVDTFDVANQIFQLQNHKEQKESSVGQ